jgi:hypothetical protein
MRLPTGSGQPAARESAAMVALDDNRVLLFGGGGEGCVRWLRLASSHLAASQCGHRLRRVGDGLVKGCTCSNRSSAHRRSIHARVTSGNSSHGSAQSVAPPLSGFFNGQGFGSSRGRGTERRTGCERMGSPPCTHFKIQSCLTPWVCFRVAAFQTLNGFGFQQRLWRAAEHSHPTDREGDILQGRGGVPSRAEPLRDDFSPWISDFSPWIPNGPEVEHGAHFLTTLDSD